MSDVTIKIPDGVQVESALLELARVSALRLLAMESLIDEAIKLMPVLVDAASDTDSDNIILEAHEVVDIHARMKRIIDDVEPVFDFGKMDLLVAKGLGRIEPILSDQVQISPLCTRFITDVKRCLTEIKDMRK